jgi:hypothetical protein
MSHRLRSSLVAAFVLSLSSSVLADDLEKAQALFEKGRALVADEKWKEACPLFEEALSLGAGIGTELNLGQCWMKIGKLVEAQKLFEGALRKTKDPSLQKAHDVAEQNLKDILERMPKLQIERGTLSESTTIYLDGTELVDTSEPIPVDPGKHVVEAVGAEKQTVIATEKQVTEVVLVGGAQVGGIGPVEPTKPKWYEGDRRPLYLGGAGATLILTGTITGILSLTKKSDGIALCTGPQKALVCGPEGSAKLDTARTLTHVTTALFVIGGGLIVTSVIWKLQERSKKPDRPVVTGWICGAGGGFALEHAW